MKIKHALVGKYLYIVIGICVLLLATGWEWPWEKGLEGTWIGAREIYTIYPQSKTRLAPGIVIDPIGNWDWDDEQPLDQNNGIYRYISADKRIRLAYANIGISIANDDVIIKYMIGITTDSSMRGERIQIEAKYVKPDKMEGTITIEQLGIDETVVSTTKERFIAGRKKE